MYVVAVNGSPRKGGNTEILLQTTLAPLQDAGWETEFVQLGGMKALLDRAGYVCLANGGLLRGKIGAAVVAVRRGGATHVFDTINHMYQMSQMVVPGSLYWNMGFGLDKGDVENDAEGLRNMKNLGQTIAWLGAAMKPHLETFPR